VTGGEETRKYAPGIIALTAQAQQFLVQALRQTEFAAVSVIARLAPENVKELRREI
jgi:hypothetical protein